MTTAGQIETVELDPSERRDVGVWTCVAVLLFYLSLMAVGLGETRALTRHEVFAAQPAREMLEGVPGAWVIQHFGGVPRYEKPPAMSWMIAAVQGVVGTQAEWSARAPSVAAGGVVVLLVMAWGARQFGREAGVVAGLMQATLFYTVMQARLAEVDMPMLAMTGAGMFALMWAWIPPPGGEEVSSRKRAVLGWVFAVCAGLAFVMKGPAGTGIMYAGALAFAGATRSKAVAWWVLHPGRLAVCLTLAAAWPVTAYLSDPNVARQWVTEATFVQGTGARTVDPWHFYLWNVPVVLLPWVVFAVPAVWSLAKDGAWRRDVNFRFAGCWLAAGVLVLSLSAAKAKHYALPALPAVTPILAWGLLLYLRHQYGQKPKGYGWAIGAWVVGFTGGVVAVLRLMPEHAANVAVVVATLGVGGAVTLALEWRRKRTAQLAALFATAWLVLAGVNLLLTPVFDTFHVYRDLGRRVSAAVPGGERVYMVDQMMGQITYYVRWPVGRIEKLGEARPEGVRWVVVPVETVSKMESAWGVKFTELDRDGIKRARPRKGDVLVFGKVE